MSFKRGESFGLQTIKERVEQITGPVNYFVSVSQGLLFA